MISLVITAIFSAAAAFLCGMFLGIDQGRRLTRQAWRDEVQAAVKQREAQKQGLFMKPGGPWIDQP